MASKTPSEKVLRIGIVHRSKIIDEREMKPRETVSIGTGSKATFQVTAGGLPKSFELFDYDGKNHYLRFTDDMSGRVQVDGDDVKTFAQLAEEGRVEERKGAKAVALPTTSRGKVVVGEVTVLFQFKAMAAAPARPVLPAELRGSFLGSLDTQFALILAVVAISSVSLVGYARSLEYAEPTSIEEVDERFQRLIMPERKPEPPREEVAEKTEEKSDKKEAKKEPEKEEEQKREPEKKEEEKKASAEEAARARKAEVAKKVAGKGLLKVLGAKGEGGGALADVFSEGDTESSLADAFSGVQGVDIASDGASGTRGGGSGEQVGIGELGTEGGGNVKSGTKKEASISGTAVAEAPDVDGELDARKVTRQMKRYISAVKSCYESALKRDANLKGKLILDFEITEEGRTASFAFGGSARSSTLESCIKRRARSWRFPRPDGGSVFISYPIILEPSS